MCFRRRRKKEKKVEKKAVETIEDPGIKQQPKAAPKAAAKTAPKAKPVKKEAPKLAPKAAPKAEPEKAEESKEVKNIYHISQNKDSKSEHFKRWRVRKSGSQKTIQYFDTQAEAITFAQDLADKHDGSIVIHKVDGSIRKQDYSK